jgi:hypothetical protein
MKNRINPKPYTVCGIIVREWHMLLLTLFIFSAPFMYLFYKIETRDTCRVNISMPFEK